MAFDNKLFFNARDGKAGAELWSFDGKEAKMEADIRPGTRRDWKGNIWAADSSPARRTLDGPCCYRPYAPAAIVLTTRARSAVPLATA